MSDEPQSPVLIRPRQPEDMAACVAILTEVYRTDGYPAWWPPDLARWLTPSGMSGCWVAELGGAVVGHVALRAADGGVTAELWSADTGRPGSEAIEITRLFVADAARGHGVGRRLLDTAVAGAVRRGLHPVLGVLRHNESAAALYEKAGWRLMSTVDFTLPDGSTSRMHCYAAPDTARG